MPMSVRLDKETEDLLERAARMTKTSKSAVVKESIREFCTPLVQKKGKNPAKVIEELIKDAPGSGRGDLSVRGGEIFKEMLRKKHRDCR